MWRLVQLIEDCTGLRLLGYELPRHMLHLQRFADEFRERHGYYHPGIFTYFNDRTLYRWWKECREDLSEVAEKIHENVWIIPYWQLQEWGVTESPRKER